VRRRAVAATLAVAAVCLAAASCAKPPAAPQPPEGAEYLFPSWPAGELRPEQEQRIHKAWTWKPRSPWSDAVASWKNADTIAIDYAAAGGSERSRIERRLDDPSWVRATSP